MGNDLKVRTTSDVNTRNTRVDDLSMHYGLADTIYKGRYEGKNALSVMHVGQKYGRPNAHVCFPMAYALDVVALHSEICLKPAVYNWRPADKAA